MFNYGPFDIGKLYTHLSCLSVKIKLFFEMCYTLILTPFVDRFEFSFSTCITNSKRDVCLILKPNAEISQCSWAIRIHVRDQPKLGFVFSAENETNAENGSLFSARNKNETATFSKRNEISPRSQLLSR